MGKFGISKTRGITLNEDGGRVERLNARWGKHVRYISSLGEVRHIHYH